MKRSLIAVVLFSGLLAETTIPVIAATQIKRLQQAAVAEEGTGESRTAP
jgi:hypothetical protein